MNAVVRAAFTLVRDGLLDEASRALGNRSNFQRERIRPQGSPGSVGVVAGGWRCLVACS
jgi:hypothetical protein